MNLTNEETLKYTAFVNELEALIEDRLSQFIGGKFTPLKRDQIQFMLDGIVHRLFARGLTNDRKPVILSLNEDFTLNLNLLPIKANFNIYKVLEYMGDPNRPQLSEIL